MFKNHNLVRSSILLIQYFTNKSHIITASFLFLFLLEMCYLYKLLKFIYQLYNLY